MSTEAAPAVRVIALIRRKPGTTREEFIEHYENHHARLIASHKYAWMADYTRNYVIPGTGITKMDGGGGALPECDVITVASFSTAEDYEAFTQASGDLEFKQAVLADEESFMDRESIRFFRVEAHVTDLTEFGTPTV